MHLPDPGAPLRRAVGSPRTAAPAEHARRARREHVSQARQAPMRARSVQYSFFGRPTRLFLMEARMLGLPVRALHVYREESATFTVRVASAVTMVDLRGAEHQCRGDGDRAQRPVPHGAGSTARLATGLDRGRRPNSRRDLHERGAPVTATLTFDDGELVDFWSDDRRTAAAEASSRCAGPLRSASIAMSAACTCCTGAAPSTTIRTARSPTGSSR